MGGKKAGDLCELRQRRSRRAGLAEKRLAVFAEKQNRRRFAGVIGGLPVPGAGRVGGAEGLLHSSAQDGGVDAVSLLEMGEKKPRGLGEVERGSVRAGARDRCDRWCGRRGRRMRHETRPRESGTRASRPALSLDRTGSNPSRPASPSRHAAALTPRHHAIRASRVAFASRSNRSPWHGRGAQKQTRSQPRSSSSARKR